MCKKEQQKRRGFRLNRAGKKETPERKNDIIGRGGATV